MHEYFEAERYISYPGDAPQNGVPRGISVPSTHLQVLCSARSVPPTQALTVVWALSVNL